MILSKNIEDYFKGYYSIEIDNYLTEDFVNAAEMQYLQSLLGIDSYFELKSDLTNGVPQSDKWKNFVNGVIYEIDNKQINYKGIIDMLQGFIYYEIYKLNNTSPTGVGQGRLSPENSELASYIQNEYEYFERYNKSVELSKEAQLFLSENQKSYDITATNITEVVGIYTVTCDMTNILINSRVLFDKYYTVKTVTGTNFTFEAETGKTFDLNFTFKLYNNLSFKKFNILQQIDY